MTSSDKPSPPWFGGLILSCLVLATAWILTYTLAPLPGQNALGGWNYVIVGVLLTLFMGLSMEWRGDPRRTEKTESGSPAKSVR
ncbi:MAG: hypothetical protein HOV83_07290 [Catenulispora sp.]|nr:hypothetical protein [Catenulispora sp.]